MHQRFLHLPRAQQEPTGAPPEVYYDTAAFRPRRRLGLGFACVVCVLLKTLAPVNASDPAAATLVVHVTGLRDHKGQLRIGLWNRAQGWTQEKYGVTGQNVALRAAHGASVDVRFVGLAPGDYAVGAFQDRNLNFRLDKTWIGIPKEPWGVSNNARPRLRAPSYEEARFRISAPQTRITVALHR